MGCDNLWTTNLLPIDLTQVIINRPVLSKLSQYRLVGCNQAGWGSTPQLSLTLLIQNRVGNLLENH